MSITVFDPTKHFNDVKALWNQALGKIYPVTDRVLYPRFCSRPTFDKGDAIMEVHDGRCIGFASLEIDRAPLSGTAPPSVQCVMVAPAHRRKGIGTKLLRRLESRCRTTGLKDICTSTGLYRFWSGIPEDLPIARDFFVAQGYEFNYDAIDMWSSLRGFKMSTATVLTMRKQGIEIRSARDSEIGKFYSLLDREQPGWCGAAMALFHAGDTKNMLGVWHGSSLVGCIQTFTPDSRFRSANLMWEKIYGPDMGGLGAVFIAKKWRGRGLGKAMCQAAARHLRESGAKGCFIDWTSHALAKFYSCIGAKVCKETAMYHKAL